MTLTSTPSLLPPFSRQLKEGTTPAHEDAESARFVHALMDGALSRDGVIDLWAQYRFVYAELEAAGDRLRDDPVVGRFVVDELRRTAALDRDLDALAGPAWAQRFEPTAATERYRRRLRDLAGPLAPGFVAHHYTRYLGDLAGGQIIGRVLSRREDLGVQLAFPVFDAIPDRVRFRERYRTWLDETPWDADQRAAVVEEARAAFALNEALFDDLAERHLPPAAASGTSVTVVEQPTAPA